MKKSNFCFFFLAKVTFAHDVASQKNNPVRKEMGQKLKIKLKH